jgi:8-oxo-dGTP pyrophosphatase MutT (NUDIX family)
MSEPRRASVLAAVEALSASDARERASRERILAACHPTAPDPFDNAALSHLTASAIVVSQEGVLLHFHKRLKMWLQPGGHIDEDELPWHGALREVLEETGLVGQLEGATPDLLHVDVHQAGPHLHYDLRYLVRASGPPSPGPGESPEVAWFDWASAMRIADAGLIGALLAAQRRLIR